MTLKEFADTYGKNYIFSVIIPTEEGYVSGITGKPYILTTCGNGRDIKDKLQDYEIDKVSWFIDTEELEDFLMLAENGVQPVKVWLKVPSNEKDKEKGYSNIISTVEEWEEDNA